MCVWCAYTGPRQAAEQIFQAGTRIEGLWSGFYTGIATVDKTGIHSAKCCGYSKYWLQQFHLQDFPGTTGFFHSRTNSGGNACWGHPFVSTNRRVALISQGSSGVFSDMTPWAAYGDQLKKIGKNFSASSRNIPLKRYPLLQNGDKVHVSEIFVNGLEASLERCGDPLQALRENVLRVQEEAISLMIFADLPDRIYFCNMNQRGAICFSSDGARASSSLLAFGNQLQKYTEIPLNCIGYFTSESLYTENLPTPSYPVRSSIPEGCLTAAMDYLAGHPDITLAEITDSGFGRLFPENTIAFRALTAHHIAEILCTEHWAETHDVEVPGPENTRGLQTLFRASRTH